MKAKLISWHCPSIDNLLDYHPEDPDSFCIYLELSIGSLGEVGEEIFGIQVCTPQWFLNTFGKNEIIFVRGFVVVFEYNFENIIERVRDLIESCTGKDWQEVAEKISRFAHWEFEDYQEEPQKFEFCMNEGKPAEKSSFDFSSAIVISDSKLLCPECFQTWECTSNEQQVTCPKCRKSFKNPR